MSKKTTLYPTGFKPFDGDINEFNVYFNKGDYALARSILRDWTRRQGQILKRLEIMAEKLKTKTNRKE